MMRLDIRLVVAGAIMIGTGIGLSMYLESTTPAGSHGMTENEIEELLLDQRINSDIGNLVAILFGVGFLLLLLSFGTKIPRRKKSENKSNDKKP